MATTTSANRQGNRERILASPGPTNTLLVVEPHWRHVGHHYCLKAPDVHADLHSGGYTQDVDRVDPLDLVLKKHPLEPPLTLLCHKAVGLSSKLFALQTKGIAK